MNRLPDEKRVKIIQLLTEGMSLRAVSRVVDCSINTVSNLFVEVATVMERYQYTTLSDLPCKFMQVDEVWSFVYSRERAPWLPNDTGDVWIWMAICPETKLVPCWHVGPRSKEAAHCFIGDLCRRFNHRIQLTSDGLTHYKEAVETVFGEDVDFAMLVKKYGSPKGKRKSGPYEGATKERRSGSPNMQKVTTAHIERQNLTLRMSNRRFTRKTNAFSKKLENHRLSVALHFMHYNFCRIHQTLRITPAMAAGTTDHVWEIQELLDITDAFTTRWFSRWRPKH